MPIASFNPLSEIITTPSNNPIIEPKDYSGVTIDTNDTPVSSLVGYIEGTPWSVNYYSQVLAESNNLRELDVNQSPVYQQYNKINNYEIRVTSALSSTTDEITGTTVIKGSANVNYFITPNTGDVFIASTVRSKISLFRITSVERKSYLKQTSWSVEYDSIGFVEFDGDDASIKYENLESKVISQYTFDKNRLVYGKNPVLSTSDQNNLLTLTKASEDLIHYYFDHFLSNEVSTFLLPGQDYKMYDPYLVQFMDTIIEVSVERRKMDMRKIMLDNDHNLRQDTLWDALLEKNLSKAINLSTQKMTIVGVSSFNTLPSVSSLVLSGVNYILFPYQTDNSTISGIIPVERTDSEVVLIRNKNPILNNTTNTNTYNFLGTNIPIIKPTFTDAYYVLSVDFYNDELTGLSLLEKTVMGYLNNNDLQLDDLIILNNHAYKWSRLEQFYYIPIIILLIQAMQRGISTWR